MRRGRREYMCGNVFRLEILMRGIQLLIHVFVYLPVYLSTYLYISLPIYLCTHLYTYKLIHMCVYTYRTHTHTHERVLDRQRNKWVGINKCFHTHTNWALGVMLLCLDQERSVGHTKISETVDKKKCITLETVWVLDSRNIEFSERLTWSLWITSSNLSS